MVNRWPMREPVVGRPAVHPEMLGLLKNQVDTPSLLLDLARFERNAARISNFLGRHDVQWRPHSKAHKSPEIALRQMELGAIGVTCSKVAEAEVMVDSGVPSVLIANEQGVRSKFDRVANLNRRAEVMTCVDDAVHVKLAAQAGRAAGVDIPILVEVDVGLSRAGIRPGQPALTLARLVDSTPGVRFMGLMGYEGHLTVWPLEEKERRSREAIAPMIETRRLIEQHGIDVPIVSGGSSGTFMTTGLIDGMTEIQAGGACLMDRFYGESCHLDDEFEYALSIVATITSRPEPGRAIMDAGFKTMSDGDGRRPRPIDRPGVLLDSLSAEHGQLTVGREAQDLAIGDRIEWIPGYSDSTTFLHDFFVGLREGRVEIVLPLLARGSLT